MEDQIIGASFLIALFAIAGWISFKSKRRWGTNPHDAKYGRKR